MTLKVLLPAEVFLETDTEKIVAEAENGYFCLLPQHVDFTATLVPGILSYRNGGRDHYLAVDVGTLVKKGPEILISVRNAAKSDELGKLRDIVQRQFEDLDERERKARASAAKLELDLLRRFMELKEYG